MELPVDNTDDDVDDWLSGRYEYVASKLAIAETRGSYSTTH
jgi:hypothetical protein